MKLKLISIIFVSIALSTISFAKGSSRSGGYVKGYTRKDGTYVSGYTRGGSSSSSSSRESKPTYSSPTTLEAKESNKPVAPVVEEKRDKEFQERQSRDMLAYELSCYPIKNCIVTGESISIKNAVKYVYHYPKQRTMDYTRPTEQTVFFSNKSTISIFEKSPEIYLEKLNKIIYDTVKFDVTNLYDDRFFITNTGFYRLENPIISITVKGELYVAKTESFLQIGNRWKLVPENFINPDTNKPCETFIGDIYITVDVPKPVGENNVKLNSSTVKVHVKVFKTPRY